MGAKNGCSCDVEPCRFAAQRSIPKPRRTLTGGLQWALPESELFVQWWGEGSPLVLVSLKPSGVFTNVMFDGYARTFSTPADAKAAFAEFFTRDGA